MDIKIPTLDKIYENRFFLLSTVLLKYCHGFWTIFSSSFCVCTSTNFWPAKIAYLIVTLWQYMQRRGKRTKLIRSMKIS